MSIRQTGSATVRAAVRSSVKPGRHAARPLYTSTKPSGESHIRPLILASTIAAGFAVYSIQRAYADEPDDSGPIVEKAKKRKGVSKEKNRDLISSQHLQVRRSWENPGVYAWGSNTGGVVAPGSSETYIKTARRIPYFDDMLLRDLKLDRSFGAAILENGDLVQWGKGYSEDTTDPEKTLTGQNLVQISLSKDRIIALSKSGTVYSIPCNKTEQQNGSKLSESSWIPLLSSTASIAYRKITPANLGYSERVVSISSGLEHALLLTSAGRVFSAASASDAFPSRGQLGVPGLTWLTRPTGDYDQPHELTTLKGFEITSIATGDYHSVVLDNQSRIFSFGDNTSGQLGFEFSVEAPYIDVPSLLPLSRLYSGTGQIPRVTSINAGGTNSYFTIDAERILAPGERATDVAPGQFGRITADTFSCGYGMKGGLGNGRWTHIQGLPTKIPSLSGLFEYDEKINKTVPIRLAHIVAGQTHTAAIMKNITFLDANEQSTDDTTNWGADVVWWGGNEFYQLGTGKRNNVSTPVYIRPLDMASEIEAGRKEEHRFHITPRHTVSLAGRGKVSMEQRIECGRNTTAVYSAV